MQAQARSRYRMHTVHTVGRGDYFKRGTDLTQETKRKFVLLLRPLHLRHESQQCTRTWFCSDRVLEGAYRLHQRCILLQCECRILVSPQLRWLVAWPQRSLSQSLDPVTRNSRLTQIPLSLKRIIARGHVDEQGVTMFVAPSAAPIFSSLHFPGNGLRVR